MPGCEIGRPDAEIAGHILEEGSSVAASRLDRDRDVPASFHALTGEVLPRRLSSCTPRRPWKALYTAACSGRRR